MARLEELVPGALVRGLDASGAATVIAATWYGDAALELADDPGAGKTIMTGLFIKELAARGDLARCLIVCPGSLAEQWQDELRRKFNLRFEILTNERIQAAGNVFEEANLAIARLDKLARDDELQQKLAVTDWDLIVCDEAHREGVIEAALLCPGHPLLEAVLDILRERGGPTLKRGAILIDENDLGAKCRLLFYLESAIQDGAILANGQHREISRQIHFVELNEDGFSSSAGYAPYLDYRPATDTEKARLLEYAAGLAWLGGDVEERAIGHAVGSLVPQHLKEVRQRKIALVDKTEKAVRQRLTAH